VTTIELLRAPFFHTPTNAFRDGHALVSQEDGGLLIRDGRIVESGDFATVRAAFPDAPVTDWRGGFVLPGCVDTHVHFPQLRILSGLELGEPHRHADQPLRVGCELRRSKDEDRDGARRCNTPRARRADQHATQIQRRRIPPATAQRSPRSSRRWPRQARASRPVRPVSAIARSRHAACSPA